ncbi:MAG: hypothetical protein KAJ07_13490 [Planctomycetes bacterium]|nr:hypothetical protein [Planctomycetota bacterium]
MTTEPEIAETAPDEQCPLKNGHDQLTAVNVVPRYQKAQTKDYWLDLEKSLAYVQGGVLTQVDIRRQKAGWRAMIKRNHRSFPQVAFIEADTWSDLICGVAEWCEKGLFTWYEDKYPPR